MKRLLLLLLLLPHGARAAASAMSALQKADPGTCVSGVEWTERAVRFSVVVHADGDWAVVVDAQDQPSQLLGPLRECLHSVVRGALDGSGPQGKTVTFTRVLTGPRAPADRVPELRASFERVRENIADCVLGAFPPGKVHRELQVRLTLSKRGTLVVDSLGGDGGVEGMAVTFCGQRAVDSLGGFAPGTTSWQTTLVVDGTGRLIQPDGRLGSVCGAPQGDFASLLSAVECKPGLTCCNSSGAMILQRCMQLARGEHYPLLP